MSRTSILSGLLVAGALVLPGVASAATITGVYWDTSNVLLGENVEDGETGESLILDRDASDFASAVSNGKIVYSPPEALAPGLQVINEGYTGTQSQDFDGCIMTSNPGDGVTNPCDGGFQSGKRIKQQVTDTGPIDLVFGVTREDDDLDSDVSAVNGETSGSLLYQVYHRLINVTGGMLDGFTVELGTGLGDGENGFVRSTAGDGLSFAQDVTFGPDKLPAFSQFPFGLFGSLEQPNPNPLELPGFFDTTARSGFSVSLGEDVIESAGIYGAYDDLFGNWLSQDMVPAGLLWDYAEGEADPLVMAWDNGLGWEFRRGIDPDKDGQAGVSEFDVFAILGGVDDPFPFFAYDDTDGLATHIAGLGIRLFEDFIEDLANLNLNFAILLGDNFTGDSFTLRVTANDVNPIPLPAAAPLLIAGLGALGFAARRRRKAA